MFYLKAKRYAPEGPFTEILIGNWYWIFVVDYHSRYSWSFFTRTESQLPKNMKEFFENITSHGMPVKYLCCKNSGEHQSKLQKACKKKNVKLKYTTPHMPQLNGVMERIFSVIKQVTLAMLLNAKLHDKDQNIMWAEAVHTCERITNSMGIMGSTTSSFEIFYG